MVSAETPGSPLPSRRWTATASPIGSAECQRSISLSEKSVSVVRGNGDGTFQAAVSYLVNPNQTSALIISPGKLQRLRQRPRQTRYPHLGWPRRPFVRVRLSPQHSAAASARSSTTAAARSPTPSCTIPAATRVRTDVIAVDVNGDGFLDIVVTNYCSTAAVAPTTACASDVSAVGERYKPGGSACCWATAMELFSRRSVIPPGV